MTTVYREHPASQLGRILQVLLAVTGGLTLALCVWLSTRLRAGTFVLHAPPADHPYARFTWTGTSLGKAWSWFTLAGLAAEVVWLIWQYQATGNLWARGYRDLQTRPGWAVGWWFIPLANLAMPCVAMLELDRRSTPDGAPRRAGPLVVCWWTSWLAAGIVPVVGTIVAVVPHLESLGRSIDERATALDLSPLVHAAAPWLIVAGVLRAVAAALAVAVVRRIDLAQRTMMASSAIAWTQVPARPDGGLVR